MAVRADEMHDQGTVDLDRDRLLVHRYQNGDDDAFDELYRRYFPRLHLYCQRRVGDPHVSEELAQEAFLRALRAMPRFAGERRFYPWMTVIAQRLCIDHHRRTSRVEPAAEVDLGAVEPDHDALFAAVDYGHLGEAMERLAPRHREVLAMREQRGWSYQRIAEHLDVPVTTVEALLHRARKALKREFLAVSGGGRLASIPVVGWVMVRVARIRSRVSGVAAEHFIPLAGSAAAGVAAIGFVLAPTGAAPTPVLTAARPAAVVSPASASTTDAAAPAATPDVVAASPAPATTKKAPAAAADLGAAQLYSGADGTAYAQQQNEQQPVQVDLPLVQAGLNPEQLANDLTGSLVGGHQ